MQIGKYVDECATKADENMGESWSPMPHREVEAASHRRGTTTECQDFQDAASNRQLTLGPRAARLPVSLLSGNGEGGVHTIRRTALITFVPPEWRGRIRRVLRC